MVRKTVQIPGLQPNERFYVQVRGVSAESIPGVWSTQHGIDTVIDEMPPAAPTGLILVADGTSFIATWESPTTNQDGTPLNDLRDFIVVVGAGGWQRAYSTISDDFEFTLAMNRNVFFDPEPEITIEVRARDRVGNLSLPVTDTAANQPPSAATLVAAAKTNAIELRWDDPFLDDGKRIEIWKNGGKYTEVGPETLTWTDTNVGEGVQDYYVRAVDVFAQGTNSNTVQEAEIPLELDSDTVPPKPPTALSVSSEADFNVATAVLSWSAPVQDVDDSDYQDQEGFELRYRTSASRPWNYSRIPDDRADGSIAQVFEAEVEGAAGATLDWAVRAFDRSGNYSGWASSSDALAEDTTPPDPPLNVQAAGGLGTIYVTWDANTEPDLDYYEVEAADAADFIGSRIVFSGRGTTVSFLADIEQFVRVSAYDMAGNKSDPSLPDSATPADPDFPVDDEPPTDVTGLTGTHTTYKHGGVERGRLVTSWNAATDNFGVTHYIVRVRQDAGAWEEHVAGGDGTSYTLYDLVPGATYDFEVKAVDAAGNRSVNWSNPESVVIVTESGTIPGTVSWPTNGADSLGVGSVTFNWNEVTNVEIRDYEIVTATNSAFTANVRTRYLAGTTLTVTATPGTTVYARVRARSVYGDVSATWSDPRSALARVAESTDLADDSVTSEKITGEAVDMSKMAPGLRPPRVVSTLPTLPNPDYQAGDTVVLSTDYKMYRNDNGTWTAAVPTTDLIGSIVSGQIADDAVTTAKLAANAVTVTELADNAVTTGKLGPTAVTAAKLASRSVQLAKFATNLRPVQIVTSLPTLPNATYPNDSVVVLNGKLYRNAGGAWTAEVATVDLTGQIVEQQLAEGSVTGVKIVDGSISLEKFSSDLRPIQIVAALPTLPNPDFPVDSVVSFDSKLYRNDNDTWTAAVDVGDIDGQITETMIADGAISTPKLQANSVTASQIAAGTVTANEIAANTITTSEIAASAITADQIAANAVTAVKIAANSVTAVKINAGAVETDKLSANAVTAAKIAADTITAAQIAAGAITAEEIAANAIVAEKIQAGAIGTDALAANAVVAAKISAGAVETIHLDAEAVTAGKIAADAVTATKIAANAVTANAIAANTITAAQIAAGAISADEIAANAIVASKIAADTIDTTHLNTVNLSAAGIFTGTLAASHITVGSTTTYETNYDPSTKATPSYVDDIEAAIRGDYGHTTDSTRIDGGRIFTGSVDAEVLTANIAITNGLRVQSLFQINAGGSIESTNFHATNKTGFRFTDTSMQMYQGDIVLGGSGLNINTETNQIWYGSTWAGAAWRVDAAGNMRVGTTDARFNVLGTGELRIGANTTSAPVRITNAGLAEFRNIRINTLSLGTPGATTNILNIGDKFVVRRLANTTTDEVRLAGNMFIDAGGNLQLGGGNITLTSGNMNMNGGTFNMSGGAVNFAGSAVNINSGGSFTVNSGDIIVSGGSGRIRSGGYNFSNKTGWALENGNLYLFDGEIDASLITIQQGANILDHGHSAFTYDPEWYDVNVHRSGGMTASITSIWSRYQGRSLRLQGGSGAIVSLSTGLTDYNVQVDPSTTYILSTYVRNNVAGARTITLRVRLSNGSYVTAVTQSIPAGSVERISGTVAVPSGVDAVLVQAVIGSAGSDFMIDGTQFEERTGSVDTPSFFKVGGVTTISGGQITAGTITADQITADGLSADVISTGTLKAAVAVQSSDYDGTGRATNPPPDGVFYPGTGTAGWYLGGEGFIEASDVAIRGAVIGMNDNGDFSYLGNASVIVGAAGGNSYGDGSFTPTVSEDWIDIGAGIYGCHLSGGPLGGGVVLFENGHARIQTEYAQGFSVYDSIDRLFKVDGNGLKMERSGSQTNPSFGFAGTQSGLYASAGRPYITSEGTWRFGANSSGNLETNSSVRIVVGSTGTQANPALQFGSNNLGGVYHTGGTGTDGHGAYFTHDGTWRFGGTRLGLRVQGKGYGASAWETGSDYRLKSDIETFDIDSAGVIIDGLEPKWYRLENGERQVGLIAHEAQKHIPWLVSGEKDGVDDDGNPAYQGIDYGKLSALLVASNKALRKRNKELESKMDDVMARLEAAGI